MLTSTVLIFNYRAAPGVIYRAGYELSSLVMSDLRTRSGERCR